MIRKRWMFAGLGLVAVLYTAWPVKDGLALRSAIRSGDSAAIDRLVDWEPLRASLKEEIAAELNRTLRQRGERKGRERTITERVTQRFGPRVVDTLVETYVTPKGLPELVVYRDRMRELIERRRARTEGEDGEDETQRTALPTTQVRWAFFTSPSRFEITFANPKYQGRRMIAALERSGLVWRLAEVRLTSTED